jgi:hypothetical protein
MTEREMAEELINEFKTLLMEEDTECGNEILCTLLAKRCAKITVRNILSANPHSNFFNTEVVSTFAWWFDVYNIINEDI